MNIKSKAEKNSSRKGMSAAALKCLTLTAGEAARAQYAQGESTDKYMLGNLHVPLSSSQLSREESQLNLYIQ